MVLIFGLGHWELILLTGLLLFFLLLLVVQRLAGRGSRHPLPDEDWICKACGTVGRPRRYVPGSALTEVLLLFCGIWPGLMYGGWRTGQAYQGCGVCRSREIIPVTTPEGYRLLKSHTRQ